MTLRLFICLFVLASLNLWSRASSIQPTTLVDTVFDATLSSDPAFYGWSETLTSGVSSAYTVKTFTPSFAPSGYYVVNLTNGSGANGYLRHGFDSVANAAIALSLDLGFAYGDTKDTVSFAIVNDSGNGYAFHIWRSNDAPGNTHAWWTTVTGYTNFGSAHYPETGVVDTTGMDGVNVGSGTDKPLWGTQVTRSAEGAWTFTSDAFGSGGISNITFFDTNYTAFSQVLLYSGGRGDKSFNNIRLDVVPESVLAWAGSAGGSWNLDTSNIVWHNGVGLTAWANNSGALFTGTDAPLGSYEIELDSSFGAISASSLSFSASGYTLTATDPTVLLLSSSADSILVEDGKQAVINQNVDIESAASFTVSGGGTLSLKGSITKSANPTYLEGGTTLTLGCCGIIDAGDGGFALGSTATADTLNIDGGTLRMASNGGVSLTLAAANGAQSLINLNGGRIIIDSVASSSGVVFGSEGVGSDTTATMNLHGGLLTAPGFTKAGPVDAKIVFDGGGIQANSIRTGAFLEGFNLVSVSTGGAIFSTGDWLGGYTVDVPQVLVHDSEIGSVKDGGLIKQDYGTLILRGMNTYSGDTVIERGMLQIEQSYLSDEADVKVGANAELKLNFSGTDTIRAFYIDGNSQATGLWGAPGSGATHITPRLQGTGTLLVTVKSLPETMPPPTKNPLIIEPHPGAATLPDPFVMRDGTPITSISEWNSLRRPEILELFRTYVYGRNPVDRPDSLTFTEEGTPSSVFNGAGIRRQIRIAYSGSLGSDSFLLTVYTPTALEKPKGIFVFINNRSTSYVTSSTANNFFAKDAIVARGYVAAGLNYEDVAIDFEDGVDLNGRLSSGVFGVFGPKGLAGRPGDAWACVAAWAWAASRAIDWIKTEPNLQDIPIAVAGHSRAGKSALWCAAQDERVDLAISNSSGSTGASLARTTYGEDIERITSVFPHWFCGNYATFANRESELPVDQHLLLALIAPRRVYVQSSSVDPNSDPRAEFESTLRAGPVFDLFNLKNVGIRKLPPVNTPAQSGSIGYHQRGAPYDTDHNMVPYDWERYMDYMDRHLAGKSLALANWRTVHLLDTEGQQDNEAPANDGVSNILKYALNIAPLGTSLAEPARFMSLGGTGGLPAFWSEDSFISFQYVRRKKTTSPGIEYIIEKSTNLVDWTSVSPNQIEDINDQWERVTYSSTDVEAETKAFYRLRIVYQ